MIKSNVLNYRSITAVQGQVNPLLLGKVVIAGLLLILLANSLANLFWQLIPSGDAGLDAVPTAASSSVFSPVKENKPPSVDIASLKGIALFGKEVAPKPEVVEEAKPVVQEEVQETKLNLSLVGSFANEVNEQRAYAIIANGRKQMLYRVDEEIDNMSNVKLLKVFTDKVILDNRGKQEALLMYPEGESLSSSSSDNAAAARRLNAGNTRTSTPNTQSTAAQALAKASDRERLEKISDAIRFTRKTKDGKMLGFRVLPGRNRAAFDQIGLQLNDVVTAIDGVSLDNLKAANQVYQEKRNATQASLTVLRGDQEISIDIDLNNINLN